MIARRLEGGIDSLGYLYIDRPGTGRTMMMCNHQKDAGCSHRCPHFGEPREGGDEGTELFICESSVLVFDKFDDGRLPKPCPSIAFPIRLT